MNKDELVEFRKWGELKGDIHFNNIAPYCRRGEIRWVYLGKNIGTESLGKSNSYSRPVLIFKKVFGHSCLAIPLTSQIKQGDYYYNFQADDGVYYCALLAQIRYLDGKRIRQKISFVRPCVFSNIQNAFFDFIKK